MPCKCKQLLGGQLGDENLPGCACRDMDPPEYYGALPAAASGSSSGGGGGGSSGSTMGLRFLAYENNVLPWVGEVERQRYPGGGSGPRMPLLEKHWLALSYQLLAFR